MRWLDSITDLMDMNLSKLGETMKDRGACSPWSLEELDMTEQLNNNNFLLFPCCTQRGFAHGSDGKESA